MGGLVRYHGFIADSSRWEGFALRDDDIVITTPSKSGTTWVQTIVALLLFDGVPAEPVSRLSPWLDVSLRSREETEALLDAQTHRRFIKTHAPLDGLPWSPHVTYISVGRDPRDAFVSMNAHQANFDGDALVQRRVDAVGDEDLASLERRWPEGDDPRELVGAFLEIPRHENHADVNLANVLDHLAQAWAVRHEPNTVLVHYRDLSADLTGEMLRLRDVLGLDLADDRVAELATWATLDSMRARAPRAAPEADHDVWVDPAAFFRGGRHGDGAAMMTDDELRRYRERCRELVDDEALLAWVHGGRVAADPESC